MREVYIRVKKRRVDDLRIRISVTETNGGRGKATWTRVKIKPSRKFQRLMRKNLRLKWLYENRGMPPITPHQIE